MNHLPTSQLFSLEGKPVICTGGTGGIGQALCKTLAEAGADIVSIQIPNDPHAESLSKCVAEIGRKLWTFDCNLADPSSLRSTFRDIWNAGITPSVLLNCAGLLAL
ncbi:NAD(P)-binding protein [Aspergillus ellipticus CBS 707.79]|uniref:NAD(P)-binding protein n=1 Tax=Aspergillus ellipticus CBS 707.79 TaxID=1448320 RepID=A0A319DBB6_9EURO|nr:NAD(P)-binding protein [Aspergillus ellipticus CBS 707.79]